MRSPFISCVALHDFRTVEELTTRRLRIVSSRARPRPRANRRARRRCTACARDTTRRRVCESPLRSAAATSSFDMSLAGTLPPPDASGLEQPCAIGRNVRKRSLPLTAVFGGGHARESTEDLREVALIGKSCRRADFREAHLWLPQHRLGPIEPSLQQIQIPLLLSCRLPRSAT